MKIYYNDYDVDLSKYGIPQVVSIRYPRFTIKVYALLDDVYKDTVDIDEKLLARYGESPKVMYEEIKNYYLGRKSRGIFDIEDVECDDVNLTVTFTQVYNVYYIEVTEDVMHTIFDTENVDMFKKYDGYYVYRD